MIACLLALVPLASCGGDPIADARPNVQPPAEPTEHLAETADPIWLSTLKGDGLVAKSDQVPQSDLVGDSRRQGYLPDAFEAPEIEPSNSPPDPAGSLDSVGSRGTATATPSFTTVISTDHKPQHTTAAAASAALTARLPPAFSEPAHGSIILALDEREPQTLQLGLRPIFSLQSPGEPNYQTVVIRRPAAAPAADRVAPPAAQPQSQTTAVATTAPNEMPSAGYRLQLASFKNRSAAAREAARLFETFEDLLRDRPLALVAADLGDRGRFHRIQFSGYPSFGTAAATCSQLKSRGQACLVLKPL